MTEPRKPVASHDAPVTAAGRVHLATFEEMVDPFGFAEMLRQDILAIEADAAQLERERLRDLIAARIDQAAAVDRMPPLFVALAILDAGEEGE